MNLRRRVRLKRLPTPGKRFTLAVIVLALWSSVIAYLKYFIDTEYLDSALASQLQRTVLTDTALWRGETPICYVGYCGPWIEEAFFSHFQDSYESSRRMKRIYLPIFWTNCHLHCQAEDKHKLQEYIDSLERGFSYFTVIQLARGIHHVFLKISIPDDLDILFYTAGGMNHGRMVRNVPIPLLNNPLSRSNRTKKFLVTFLGSTDTHRVRKDLSDMYSESFSFQKNDEWKTIMEQSYYSLCPRGFGPTSFRLYESILLGSIPIYVWEDELILPFQEFLHWKDFSIIVNSSEIHTILDRVVKSDFVKMSKALDNVKDYFTFDFVCSYIMNNAQQ